MSRFELRADGALLNGDGQTYEEWEAEQFEFENCHECGRGVGDHEPCVFLGNWFAKCREGEGG